MASLSEKLAIVDATMRTTKESWVKTEPEDTDLAIYIHLWRGDDLVVTLLCPVDRDTGLSALHMAVAGFNATAVAMTFESYHSTLGTSPVTGKRWEHHEMQFVFETVPDSVEKGWVAECLTTTIHDRDSNVLMSSAAYAIEDKQVRWLTEEEWPSGITGESGVPGGLMFEVISQAMKAPTLDEKLKEEGPFKAFAESIGNEERQHFHMDVACLQALMDKKLITGSVLAAPTGSEREKWITERFGKPDVQGQ